MPDTIGLKQRIREAQSSKEVKALLDEGETYEFASGHTVRSWQRVSRDRLQVLKRECKP